MPKYCPGCGAVIQVNETDKPGYVPANVLAREEDVICQRCYRIIHYGQEQKVEMTRDDYVRTVRQVLREVAISLVVIDVVDFEGSFDPALFAAAGAGQRRVGVLVNKTDLLPPQVPRWEVREWTRRRLQRAGVDVDFVQEISCRTGKGFTDLISHLTDSDRPGPVALIGVTNVGKSSVIRRLAPSAEKIRPTVSRFAGTTLGTIKVQPEKLGVPIIDTPGLVPEERILEMVCDECRQVLIPSEGLAGKLFQLDAGRSVLFGNLASVTSHGSREVVISVYGASGIKFHATRAEKAGHLLRESPQWLQPGCSQCVRGKLASRKISLRAGYDLAVSGLGWLSVRKGEFNGELMLPEGVKTVQRPNLIGKKDFE